MKVSFAPMEGLTDSVYRRLHGKYFPGVDSYYMPFLSPTVHRSLTAREAAELPPADTVPIRAVPQLLTHDADDFLWAARQCAQRGYTRVNLNLGCPSGTVVAKKKGAGMLAEPEKLDRFLEIICAGSPIPVSVKTRIGLNDSAEFPTLLEVFNRHGLAELIIHPRLRTQFYKGGVDMDAFRYAYAHTSIPLCYNGDIRCYADIRQLQREFPRLNGVMIGRGLLTDPGMLAPGGTDKDTLAAFSEALLREYPIRLGGSRNALFRLKEHWSYLICRFDGSEKLGKRLRKAADLTSFSAVVDEIFRTLPLTQYD